MDIQKIEKRIQITHRKRELDGIIMNMKQREKKYDGLSKFGSIAASFLLLGSLFLYSFQLSNEKLINSTSYSYSTRGSMNETKNILEKSYLALNNKKYDKIISLLEKEPDSDHKDWLLIEANIGLEKYSKVIPLLRKVEENQDHQYNSRISLFFKIDLYILYFKKSFCEVLDRIYYSIMKN
ncbi:hypothetical protein [Flammeovirga kamogawensis]|uniref:Tetratricopeptide repeat protein n=1 Tax=Flammeovirga kamogawensis TaxID=373891 RepID=A0ABX8GQ75_9BACT|nr:hypothetical protein [Flammeovirga kamogawensis]MBB6461999.1 hypothetical protein [Flammeovirga kamogawensis]QWG05739.1 hypothetical protein KM029_10120 [Flammeovirga kamogawensis]TRX67565.1 hypothetical protein EO216_05140 [Flammeovirga kamogawensis]